MNAVNELIRRPAPGHDRSWHDVLRGAFRPFGWVGGWVGGEGEGEQSGTRPFDALFAAARTLTGALTGLVKVPANAVFLWRLGFDLGRRDPPARGRGLNGPSQAYRLCTSSSALNAKLRSFRVRSFADLRSSLRSFGVFL